MSRRFRKPLEKKSVREARRGAKAVLVANRSVERAERLAGEFGGRAVRHEA